MPLAIAPVSASDGDGVASLADVVNHGAGSMPRVSSWQQPRSPVLLALIWLVAMANFPAAAHRPSPRAAGSHQLEPVTATGTGGRADRVITEVDGCHAQILSAKTRPCEGRAAADLALVSDTSKQWSRASTPPGPSQGTRSHVSRPLAVSLQLDSAIPRQPHKPRRRRLSPARPLSTYKDFFQQGRGASGGLCVVR